MAATEELSFKIVKLVGSRQEHDEIVLQASDFLILSGGFRESAVRVAKRALGDAPGSADHAEI
jgi:hypothetical protein